MATRSGLARFLAMRENRSALLALQDMLLHLANDASPFPPNPLYVHGPSGSGKTCLIQAMAEEAAACDRCICVMSANDFADLADMRKAREADMLIVEDLQHLPTRYVS